MENERRDDVGEGIELPAPTSAPLYFALGLALLLAGLVTNEIVSAVGGATAVLGAIGYAAGESEEVWRPLLQRYTVWLVLGAVALVAVYVGIQRRRSRST